MFTTEAQIIHGDTEEMNSGRYVSKERVPDCTTTAKKIDAHACWK
jgi:hypothetical protein